MAVTLGRHLRIGRSIQNVIAEATATETPTWMTTVASLPVPMRPWDST